MDNTQGYRDLAEAIVKMAIYDYKRAKKRLEKNPDDAEGFRTKNDVEKFMRSEWFMMLCPIDGEGLLRELNK